MPQVNSQDAAAVSLRVRELLSATSHLYMHAERQEVANAAETDSALEMLQLKYKVRDVMRKMGTQHSFQPTLRYGGCSGMISA